MPKKRQHKDTAGELREAVAKPRENVRKASWDDAEIVIDIRHTKPGTPLDDLLRRRQTEALLELLSVCVKR
jgi:hypothetical protein